MLQVPDSLCTHLRRSKPAAAEQAVVEWAAFTRRQQGRYVPAPPDPSRRMAQDPACYRLRMLRLSGLPSDAPEGKVGRGGHDSRAAGHTLAHCQRLSRTTAQHTPPLPTASTRAWHQPGR